MKLDEFVSTTYSWVKQGEEPDEWYELDCGVEGFPFVMITKDPNFFEDQGMKFSCGIFFGYDWENGGNPTHYHEFKILEEAKNWAVEKLQLKEKTTE
jgi:hypothetical protein